VQQPAASHRRRRLLNCCSAALRRSPSPWIASTSSCRTPAQLRPWLPPMQPHARLHPCPPLALTRASLRPCPPTSPRPAPPPPLLWPAPAPPASPPLVLAYQATRRVQAPLPVFYHRPASPGSRALGSPPLVRSLSMPRGLPRRSPSTPPCHRPSRLSRLHCPPLRSASAPRPAHWNRSAPWPPH
jgi:hypothetical protein